MLPSDAGTGGTRGATASPPIFSRSVNPIPTGEGRLSPPITTAPPPQFFSPSSITATRHGMSKILHFCPVESFHCIWSDLMISWNILIFRPNINFCQKCFVYSFLRTNVLAIMKLFWNWFFKNIKSHWFICWKEKKQKLFESSIISSINLHLSCSACKKNPIKFAALTLMVTYVFRMYNFFFVKIWWNQPNKKLSDKSHWY